MTLGQRTPPAGSRRLPHVLLLPGLPGLSCSLLAVRPQPAAGSLTERSCSCIHSCNVHAKRRGTATCLLWLSVTRLILKALFEAVCSFLFFFFCESISSEQPSHCAEVIPDKGLLRGCTPDWQLGCSFLGMVFFSFVLFWSGLMTCVNVPCSHRMKASCSNWLSNLAYALSSSQEGCTLS